jgi:hypothetical protein
MKNEAKLESKNPDRKADQDRIVREAEWDDRRDVEHLAIEIFKIRAGHAEPLAARAHAKQAFEVAEGFVAEARARRASFDR